MNKKITGANHKWLSPQMRTYLVQIDNTMTLADVCEAVWSVFSNIHMPVSAYICMHIRKLNVLFEIVQKSVDSR